MGWFGPQTGARDGGKEFKASTLHRGASSGAHWKAEEKKRKQLAAKEARRQKRADKQAEKKGWF